MLRSLPIALARRVLPAGLALLVAPAAAPAQPAPRIEPTVLRPGHRAVIVSPGAYPAARVQARVTVGGRRLTLPARRVAPRRLRLRVPAGVRGRARVLALIPPATPRRPRLPARGLFEDLQYLTGWAQSARLDAFAALGVRYARFQLIWKDVQSTGPDRYDWTYYDALVGNLLARGLRPLPVIGTTPAWARAAGCVEDTCRPADPAAYARFAGAAAARYAPQGVGAWEIWNEPNSSTFFKPAPDAAAYARMLALAHDAIHAVDPRAVVVSGGLAPAATMTGAAAATISPQAFLAGIYAAGGRGTFDAVGHHPYTYPRLPGTPGPDDGWWAMIRPDGGLRALMEAHGDADKRIWATEFGAHTLVGAEGGVDEARQAEILRTGWAVWRRYPWAGPLIFYTYHDGPLVSTNREWFFGLTRADGTPKPALAAVKAIAAER